MLETVERMVQNGDAWFVLIIVGLIIFAAKQGYMKVRTEKILIGRESSEKERLLMKKQSEYAHSECMAFEKELPRFEGYDETLGQLIAEKVYDEVVNWIMINHIENSEDYIKNKQRIIWNIVTSELISDKLRSKKVKDEIYSHTDSMVKELVKIRTNSNKEDEP